MVEEESEAVPLEAVDVLQQRSRRLRLRRSAMCIGGEVGAGQAGPGHPQGRAPPMALVAARGSSGIFFPFLGQGVEPFVCARLGERGLSPPPPPARTPRPALGLRCPGRR